jgi:DNA repair exonuclease SbcCD nuclease subunit
MARILHTADWQLGLKLRFVPGDPGAQLRGWRFDVIRTLAGVAKARAVDAVVVAGDVFDDNAVGRRTLEATREALEAFAPIPVLLLPGNHDPATPGGALERLEAGSHVRVLRDETPVTVAGIRFHPCPLRQRHVTGDPTGHLPPRVPDDPILVAIAHGGAIDFDVAGESPNVIDVGAVLARGYDYLALGDWHGLRKVDARAWYPGAPEPTRLKEQDPGHALLVEIDGPGAVPVVEAVAVARSRWVSRAFTLDSAEDVDALLAWLNGLPDRTESLVELVLDGTLTLGDRARLDEALQAAEETFLHLRVRADGLHAQPTEADLDALATEGFVGAAARALQAEARALQAEGRALQAEASTEAADALRLLYRLHQEERSKCSG